jgi:hypothetical protein
MSDQTFTIELGRSESLVLFDLLADFDSQTQLDIPSSAERLALIRLHGALESAMVEPFQPDYQKLLASARAKLVAQDGTSQ